MSLIAISRFVRKPITIGEYSVPANTIMTISPYAVHHDESLWKEAKSFIPERFNHHTDEQSDANIGEGPSLLPSSPFAFIPFSQGPRKCIGQQFAMLEAKTILVMLLSQFTVTAPPFSLAEQSVDYVNGDWVAKPNPTFNPSDLKEAMTDWIEAITIRPANKSGWILFKKR